MAGIVYSDDSEPGVTRREVRRGRGDEAGETHPVSSNDIDGYIHEAMDEAFTAEHFRTRGASVLAFGALATGGRAAFRAGLMLPRTAQYPTRIERGLIAFLASAAANPRKAA